MSVFVTNDNPHGYIVGDHITITANLSWWQRVKYFLIHGKRHPIVTFWEVTSVTSPNSYTIEES